MTRTLSGHPGQWLIPMSHPVINSYQDSDISINSYPEDLTSCQHVNPTDGTVIHHKQLAG